MSEDIQKNIQKMIDDVLDKSGALESLELAKKLKAAGLKVEQNALIPKSSLIGLAKKATELFEVSRAEAIEYVFKAFEHHGINVVDNEVFAAKCAEPDDDNTKSRVHGMNHRTGEVLKDPRKEFAEATETEVRAPSNEELH